MLLRVQGLLYSILFFLNSILHHMLVAIAVRESRGNFPRRVEPAVRTPREIVLVPEKLIMHLQIQGRVDMLRCHCRRRNSTLIHNLSWLHGGHHLQCHEMVRILRSLQENSRPEFVESTQWTPSGAGGLQCHGTRSRP